MVAIDMSAFSIAAIYLMMLVILLVRPRGLFGDCLLYTSRCV